MLDQWRCKLHEQFAKPRRIRVLSRLLAELIEPPATVLDVGCGSGEIAAAILAQRPGISVRGIDVVVRPDAKVPVEYYDGKRIPAEDKSIDYVMLVDVLHHTDDPCALLKESLRVANRAVLLKDHNCNSGFARRVMSFTDWFANRHHGVPLPFNFWRSEQWKACWKELGAAPEYYSHNLGLYPFYSRLYFAENMDFIARLPVAPGRHELS